MDPDPENALRIRILGLIIKVILIVIRSDYKSLKFYLNTSFWFLQFHSSREEKDYCDQKSRFWQNKGIFAYYKIYICLDI